MDGELKRVIVRERGDGFDFCTEGKEIQGEKWEAALMIPTRFGFGFGFGKKRKKERKKEP